MVHDWNNRPEQWEQAFERLNRDIYFNVCYGEPMLSNGFTEIINMIGRHDNWECNLITNLTQSPTKLIQTKLARDNRLYVIASWHPLGGADWEPFKNHLLELQAADIKTIVMYVFYPPQIEPWKTYFKWFDQHNIRTYVRRYGGEHNRKPYPQSYSPQEKQFLTAVAHHPWNIKYCVNTASPFGQLCNAGKDKILVHSDGKVSYCADECRNNLGNIFDLTFKLNTEPISCPSKICGGDHGLFQMLDPEIGPCPDDYGHDCFTVLGAGIKGGGREPVQYPNRAEMMKWLTT